MSSELNNIGDALADAIEAAAESIVRVEARRRLPASGIVWADGVLVTASHVVQDEEDIHIGLPDGERVSATLVGRDPASDLAVLRTEASGLTIPQWLPLEEARVGQLALAVGRPGSGVQASLGIVRAAGTVSRRVVRGHHRGGHHGPPHHVRRRIKRRVRHGGGHEHRHEKQGETAHSSSAEVLLADLVMYPGFSGGALVSASGQLFGMNTSAMVRDSAMTIPLATLERVTATLLEHGRMRQGYLGISAQPARLPDALAEELDQETGLLLVSVEPGSPAAQAELLLGDTIVALDGIPTPTLDDLLELLAGERVGQTVSVQIVRGGELKALEVTISERL